MDIDSIKDSMDAADTVDAVLVIFDRILDQVEKTMQEIPRKNNALGEKSVIFWPSHK